jgi:hypothetical protein
MAQLNMAFEHGQPWEVALAKFEAAVERARTDHGTAAALAGPSYEVVLELGPTHVRATGRVPLMFKLLEPVVRRYVEQTMREVGSGSA